jgi:hypothetical protein
MHRLLLKIIPLTVLTGSLLISSSLPSFSEEVPTVVWVKSFSVDTLAIDLTKNSKTVKMVAILKSSNPIEESDLKCEGIEGPKEQTFSLLAIDDGYYRASCSVTFGATDVRGRNEVSLGINDDESRIGWTMVPINAKHKIPESFEDSFGIKRTKKSLVYGIQNNSVFFAAPIAVSPPSDYKVPNFKKSVDGYLIFDSSDTAPSKPVVRFSGKAKNMDLSCPLPVTKVNSKVKYQILNLLWINDSLVKPQGILGSWFESKYYRNLPLPNTLKGKNVKLACATKFVLPESNVVLAYTESSEVSLNIPK